MSTDIYIHSVEMNLEHTDKHKEHQLYSNFLTCEILIYSSTLTSEEDNFFIISCIINGPDTFFPQASYNKKD